MTNLYNFVQSNKLVERCTFVQSDKLFVILYKVTTLYKFVTSYRVRTLYRFVTLYKVTTLYNFVTLHKGTALDMFVTLNRFFHFVRKSVTLYRVTKVTASDKLYNAHICNVVQSDNLSEAVTSVTLYEVK